MNWKDNFPKQNRAFETQNGILYHGNSEEILPLFKDNSINGIITDPPYVYLKHKLDKNFDEELIIGNFSRLTKNGILAIFGRGLSFYKRNLIASKYGFNFKEEIIWNKKRMSNPLGVIGRIHENIAIFSKGKKLNKIKIDTFQDIDNREEYSIYKDRLRRLIDSKEVVRIMESHNALSGLIVENVQADNGIEYDGMWSSSLTDSTSKGKPDIEAVDVSTRINTINEIFEVTTKPMIYDADTGGKPEHFEFTVRSLERTGVSAVIIEDKTKSAMAR